MTVEPRLEGARDIPNPADTRPTRRVEGLLDVHVVVAADGGLTTPDGPDTSLSAAELVGIVRDAGGHDCDVRLLAAPGEQNVPTLRAVARLLDRDVLIAPPGADLVRVPARPAPGLGAGDHDDAEGGEVIPVESATGCPVDWLIVQPNGQVGAEDGWYELVGGLVVPRSGLVALPLPGGGRVLATRENFVRSRADAVALRPGHPGLTTVAVGIRAGQFVIGDYDGSTKPADGQWLAAVLSALPLYLANLRLWFAWPEPSLERRRLRRNLTELADVTGATVWVPTEGGRAEILDGCRDLGALGQHGDPLGWESFGPPGPFVSDVDGRLVPSGGVHVSRYPGVPLVSVLPAREAELADRYARIRPSARRFRCDLAILGDGRLAARYADGSLLAIGARQLAALLRDSGWPGNDIMLVSTMTPERASGAREHLAGLAAELGCAMSLAEPLGGTTPANGDIRGDSHDGSSVVALHDAHRTSGSTTGWAADYEGGGQLLTEGVASRFIDGPRLSRAARDVVPHGLSWLPPRPNVNDEEFDLYLECFADPIRAASEGVPSPTLFLAGHLDRDRLAARTSAEHLLQVRVHRGGAVDLGASEVTPPPAFAATLSDSDVYVLPAGWLNKTRLVGALSVTRAGAAAPEHQWAEPAVLLWTHGAAHGVPGLPADAVRWPTGRLRAHATRYLLVAEDDPRGLGDWQRVYYNRPDPRRGYRLLEVRIGRSRAIDVVATSAQIEKLGSVRSAAGQLLSDGVEILLPAPSYPEVIVRRVWRCRHGSWRAASDGAGQRLIRSRQHASRGAFSPPLSVAERQ